MTTPDPTERILLLVERLHYVTPEQVRRRFYGKTLQYVRQRLADLTESGMLTRGTVVDPNKKAVPGKPFVYSLGQRGWHYLQELGVDVPERWRESEHQTVSISTFAHTELVNDCLIELELMDGPHRLEEFIHELEFRRHANLPVRPDAWLDIRTTDGDEVWQDCYLLEADRGNEGAMFFKRKVARLVQLVKSGQYQALFGTDVFSGVLVVATTPERAIELRRWVDQAEATELFKVTDDYRKLPQLL